MKIELNTCKLCYNICRLVYPSSFHGSIGPVWFENIKCTICKKSRAGHQCYTLTPINKTKLKAIRALAS